MRESYRDREEESNRYRSDIKKRDSNYDVRERNRNGGYTYRTENRWEFGMEVASQYSATYGYRDPRKKEGVSEMFELFGEDYKLIQQFEKNGATSGELKMIMSVCCNAIRGQRCRWEKSLSLKNKINESLKFQLLEIEEENRTLRCNKDYSTEKLRRMENSVEEFGRMIEENKYLKKENEELEKIRRENEEQRRMKNSIGEFWRIIEENKYLKKEKEELEKNRSRIRVQATRWELESREKDEELEKLRREKQELKRDIMYRKARITYLEKKDNMLQMESTEVAL